MIGIGIGIPFYKASGFDPDASAFITAAGITDQTQKTAINQLVIDLKSAGLWNKMKAIYPFVGGTASAHKFNLKDPRDLDAAFRLVFNGGWTHSANGITGNGTNTNANTYLNPSTEFSLSANSYGVYIRNNTQKGYDIGALISTNDTMLAARYTDGNAYFCVTGTTYRSVVNSNSQGTYIFSKNGLTTNNLYKNKLSIISSSDASIYANDNFRIGAGGSAYVDVSDHNYAFAFFSTQGLNLTNAELLTDIIVEFQTTLGRNV